MTLKVLVVAALVVVTLARPDNTYNNDPQPPAQYDFSYTVKDDDSGNDFGHQENRDGDFTKGNYHVQLPDGRLQQVAYNVEGDSGFVAEVTYQGEAQYPPQQPQPYA
ncbi:pro-resilin-like [Homarus americanus]|uniref:pro-resilin-like n=1 Tax=Homarus americanus TaxID=6706 RepID=UPI001C4961A7|nr:pro-resilin-like [Homarus americanus]